MKIQIVYSFLLIKQSLFIQSSQGVSALNLHGFVVAIFLHQEGVEETGATFPKVLEACFCAKDLKLILFGPRLIDFHNNRQNTFDVITNWFL